MPKFGIFSNIIAVRDTTPHIKLPAGYMSGDSRWCYYDHEGVRRMRGRSNVGVTSSAMPDSNPVLRYHFHIDVNQSYHVFAFTKAHAYKWDSVGSEWDLFHTCASDATYWSTASFNGKVIATNWVDKVQVWDEDTPATIFAPLGSASGVALVSGGYLTKARFVAVYENYIHLLSTEENGATYPARDRWAARGDESDWDTGGSGDPGSRDFSAGTVITGCGAYTANGANQFIVFTNRTVELQWLVTDGLVFEWQTQQYALGCAAPDSVVNDVEGNLYFLGTDSCIHRVFDDRRLSQDIDTTIRNLHPDQRYYVRAHYLPKLDRIWWAIPADGATTNTMVASLDPKLLAWDPLMAMAVSAFGEFSNAVDYTWDTIPFDSWDEILWNTWDSSESLPGWLIDIAGDYSGYTYQIAVDPDADAGAAYTSEVVLGTDLAGNYEALSEYKRTEGFWIWLRREPDTTSEATVSIQADADGDYVEYATVDLSAGTGKIVRTWCPADIRGRDFLIKIGATSDFAFYGIQFLFSWDGDQ